MLEQDRECLGLGVRYVSSSRLGSDVQDVDEEEDDRLEEDLLVKLCWSMGTLGCLW